MCLHILYRVSFKRLCLLAHNLKKKKKNKTKKKRKIIYYRTKGIKSYNC